MANLNDFKWETHQMCRAKGWDTSSVDGVWLLLSEEFGELASAIRQERGSFRKWDPVDVEEGVKFALKWLTSSHTCSSSRTCSMLISNKCGASTGSRSLEKNML